MPAAKPTATKHPAPTVTVIAATFDRRPHGPVYRAVRESQPIAHWKPVGPEDYRPPEWRHYSTPPRPGSDLS